MRCLSLTLIFTFLGIGSPLQEPTLFERIVTTPTGNNGYEEYLRACDMIAAGFMSLDPDRVAGPLGENYLSSSRVLVSRYELAIQLVRLGNRKKVFDPRTNVTFHTQFPELGYFRWLHKLLFAKVYVSLADGNSSAAVETAMEMFKFVENSSGNSPSGLLVGRSAENSLCALLSQHFGAIGEEDAKKLEQFLTDRLKANNLRSALVAEQSAVLSLVASMFTDAGRSPNFTKGDPGWAHLSDYSAGEGKAAAAEIHSLLSRYYRELNDVLTRPESEWKPPERPIGNNTASWVANAFIPEADPWLQRELITRTRLRLLRLAMRIIQHRWQHDRLPVSLAAFKAPDLVTDPLNGGSFTYKPTESGFEVMSEGNRYVGRVGLKVPKQPLAMEEQFPPPPPITG